MSNITTGGLTPGVNSSTNTVIAVDAHSEYLKSLALDHCVVEAKAGRPAKGNATSQQNLDAIAVSVTSTNPDASVTIEDSTLSAQAQQGSAVALYNHGKTGKTDSDRAANVRLSGDAVKLRAQGGGAGTTFAIGFLNATGAFGRADYALTAKPALLDARVEFEGSGARNSFALASDGSSRSAAAAPFSIGPGFSGSDLPAYIGGLFESPGSIDARPYPVKPVGVTSTANGSGRYIASFADGVGAPGREAAALSFANGAASPRTAVALADDGIRFESGSQAGEASIWREDGEVVYETFEDAVADLADGETIVLNKDLARAVQFARADSEKGAADPAALSFAVDLDGHSMKRFTLTSRARVRLFSSDEPYESAALIGTTGQATSYPSAALVNAGAGSLVVDGLPVVVDNASSGAYGAVVAGGGSLSLEGSASITVNASTGDTRGVWVESGSFSMEGDGNKASPSVRVNHSAPVGSAIGIDCTAAKGLDLNHASVSASGAAERLVGVSVPSEAQLSASDSSFSVNAAEGTGHAGCVELADAVKARFEGCAFDLKADGGAADGECIGAASVGGRSPSVTLSGASAFGALDGGKSAHVRHEGAPLKVNDSFALKEGGAESVIVASSGLAAKGNLDVFAEPASEDGNLEHKVRLFKAPADAGEYAGYVAEAVGGKIAWSTDSVAQVGTETYKSLARALGAAPQGGTVTILKNFASGPVAVSQDVTVDLAGRKVQVMGSATAAVTVSSGTLTLKDSAAGADPGDAEKGSLTMCLSASGESDRLSAASGNRGVVVTGSGSLVIDGARVTAVYGGTGHAGSLCAVYAGAAGNDEPSVQVLNGASVKAESSRQGSPSGAFETYGIYDGAVDKGEAVVVDESSSVTASSTLAPVARGSVVGDAGSTTGLSADTNPLNQASIRRLDADEDSELYREIRGRFLVDAKYDRSAAPSGMGSSSDVGVYGARVYWAAPMKLSTGTYAWAFSEPVADELVGQGSAMTPAAVYVQTTYEVPFDAVGIGGAASAKGSVSVRGAVSATSAHGNAYGLRMPGSGSVWTVAGASVGARADGAGSYLKNTGEPPDLKAAVGIDEGVQMGTTHNFYPTGSKVSEVVEALPEAAAIAGEDPDEGKPALSLEGAVSLSASSAGGGRSAGIAADRFAVGGDFSSTEPVTVSGSGGASKKGSEFAVASGDGAITGQQRDSFADADGKLYPELAEGGKVMRWGEAYTLTFVDYYGAPVAVEEGVLDGREVKLPEAPRSETSTTEYKLVGWSTVPDSAPGGEGIVPQGEDRKFTFSAGDLPHEVTYHAVYKPVAKSVTVTFEGAKDADGKAVGPERITVDSGEAIGDKASGAPGATSYGSWRFVGWLATVSSTETITNGTKGQVKRVIDPMALSRYGTVQDSTLSAYYVYVGAGQQLASFKIDDYVYAYAVDKGAVPSAREAMATVMTNGSAVERGPERLASGESWTFSGWSEDRSDERDLTAAYGPDEALPAVKDEDAFYTAVFTKGDPIVVTVTLHYYNNWGSAADSSWTYNERSVVGGKDSYQVPYGTDLDAWDGVKPVDYAENGEQGWRAHRFLGWSVRYTDKEPLGERLPKVGDGYTNYYAIYSDEPMEVSVRLELGDGTSALVEAPASATVDDLAGLEDYLAPTPPAGKVFNEGSWTDDEEKNPLAGITQLKDLASFSGPADGDGRCEGSATLYAVFDDAPRVRVSMHGGTDAWEDREFEVPQGTRIDTQGYSAPYKLGSAFVGWNTLEDGSGNSFDLAADAVEGEELDLWAQYEPIEPASDASGASVDVGGAYVNKATAIGADSSGASIAEAGSYDRVIVPDTAAYEVVKSYRLELKVAREGERVYVESGFGTMRVTLPVPAPYAGREIAAYVVNSSGSADFVACKVQDGADGGLGTQSSSQPAVLDVSNYGASNQGNIVLVAELTSLDLAKRSALQQMQAYLDSLREEDYEASDYDLLVKDFEQGSKNVRAAATAEEVKAAAQAAVDAMASYPSKAGLAEAKASALVQLASAYSTYNKNDYTDENWAALGKAYDEAKEAVLGAATKAAAAKAASDGAIAMSEVTVKSGGGSSGSGSAGQDGGGTGTDQGSGGDKEPGGGQAESGVQRPGSSEPADTPGSTSGLSLTDTSSGLSSGGGLAGFSSRPGADATASVALSDTGGTPSDGSGAAPGGDASGGEDDAAGGDGSAPSPAGTALRVSLGLAMAAAACSLAWWFWRRRGSLVDDDEDFWEDGAVADGAL